MTFGALLLSTGRFVPKPRREPRVAAPIPVSSGWPELGEAAGAGASPCRDAELCEETEGELGRRAIDPATTDEGAGGQSGAAFEGGGGGVTAKTGSWPCTWAFTGPCTWPCLGTVGAAARRGGGGAAGSRSWWRAFSPEEDTFERNVAGPGVPEAPGDRSLARSALAGACAPSVRSGAFV